MDHLKGFTTNGKSNKRGGLKGLLVRGGALVLMLWAALSAWATDYVFVYNSNNYLSVNDNGQIANSNSLTAGCVWTCVSNTSTLEAASLDNSTSRFLYTIVDGQKYWLVGSTTDGTAITVTTTPPANAYWRNDNTSLHYYSTNAYYVYYRSSSWRTSHTNSTNNGDNYYNRRYNNGTVRTEYRSTTTAGTNQNESSSTEYTLSTPTIDPTSISLYNGESHTFTGTATVNSVTVTIPQHSVFNSTQHYYNGTLTTNTADFAVRTPGEADNPTAYNWSLSSTTYASVSSGTVTVNSAPETDQTVTLTCTARYTAHSQNLSQSVTATVYILATNPAAPVISLYGNSQAQITCASQGATIYYTTDGTTPTDESTPYTGPFDLTTSPTTVKAVAVRNGHNSSTTETSITCKLPTPVISLTGAVATVTAGEGTPAGTKLYYTTDGTTPTASSTEITSGSTKTLTNSQTIKVIAIKSGYDNSDIAMADYLVEGVNDGLVVLDDREEHSWAYYSDANCPVHQLNPADVKITYYGYGTKTMTSSNTDQLPANSAFDQTVANTAVQVNKNEAGHTFIYYKTLENANEDGSGNYPYTMIPNPFQMRPTYNSDWRGFYAWRVKSLSSGLSIKVGSTTYDADDISNGIIIYAEQEVEFITTSEYGNAVEFEALWAKAYLNDDAQGHRYANSGDYRNAYERNFKKVTSLTTYTYPVTISSINPDGSGDVGTVTRTTAYTCSNDVKLENMTLGTGNTIAANSYNLAIGRGVANGNGNVATTVYGDASPGTVSTRFTLRVESGKYSSDFYLFYSSNNNTACVATYILGSDYDRAKNDNSKLNISGEVDMGGNGYYCSNANSRINTYILSGTIGAGADDKEVYMGFVNSGSACNTVRKLEIFGGLLQNGIAGGIEGGSVSTTNPNMTMRIRGGTINRRFYGAGTYSPAYGDKRIVVTGGTITTWISGGAYGKNNTEGNTQGDIYLYFGGRASQTNTDGIFGAGYGTSAYANGTTKYTVANSSVVFADEATTTGSVYGGGNNGYATGDIQVYVAGGTVAGNVFGGANKAPSQGNVAVTVTKGSVTGGVYGGSNQSGAISGAVTVDVYGTDPQPGSGYAIGKVFGGGNVAAYSGTPAVTVHCGDNISIGEVYGGGNAATVTGTNVTVSGGNRIGNVYGGCYGADVTTNGTKVNIKGGTIEHVYGGNNYRGTITGAIRVRAHKDSDCPMKIGELYGGGNEAGSAAGSIDIGCTGTYVEGVGGHADCNETDNRIGYELEGIGDVFGGANQANISTGITLTIDSGMVYRVFGGNNNSGTIGGTITVNIQKTNPNTCGWYVGYVYGGGFNADYSNNSNNNPSVNVSAGLVSHSVFGGGKGDYADITGNPRVTLSGTAQVGENVYGGGDAADVIGNTSVILKD